MISRLDLEEKIQAPESSYKNKHYTTCQINVASMITHNDYIVESMPANQQAVANALTSTARALNMDG